ncbi:GNAT family N-acetyltransferase [Tessaracoccus sp. OH4464_COT-324]|uniref:GNAT family N-acetyltransferase n=1 Tax=Tessaracoccus sp. OH4464_COT-324 TaxID=2491059 RepID=UPI000F63CC96|nr:GNAT family N-acetyltransferase [Tessaracoccus sp. OH4464_COT-324]RRD47763.1 N-acetyltransferase [Tessaracoccus sp. OH4464_COT-324]
MINTVRLAMPAEAVDIARIQRKAWGESPQLRFMLERINADEASQIWHQAITRAQLATMRVLVALGEAGVAAFAATQPSSDPDASPATGQIAEFIVDPAARDRGHGSRLMQATVDTLRADGFDVATIWLPSTADRLRAFFTSSGWAADGAHQESATEDGQHSIKLIRLATDIRA